MDQDARAKIIDKPCELRQTFDLTHPEKVIKANQVYASDAYGSMLYNFSNNAIKCLFKSWNTFVNLPWNVSREHLHCRKSGQ